LTQEIFTLQEAADFLRVSTKTVERMVKDPRSPLQFHRIEGVQGRRCLRAELLACIVPDSAREVPANFRKESA
jgi:excisionase family DNA binding protein